MAVKTERKDAKVTPRREEEFLFLLPLCALAFPCAFPLKIPVSPGGIALTGKWPGARFLNSGLRVGPVPGANAIVSRH